MAYLIVAANGFKLWLWTKPLKRLDCACRGAPGLTPGLMRVHELDSVWCHVERKLALSEVEWVEASLAEV
ncbi:MAG TPA: hypothetical protein VGY75_12455 [Candidatus Udaeobacter sp.]|nr:hypothetical protein [Candidatus Udaeobacter sp.]